MKSIIFAGIVALASAAIGQQVVPPIQIPAPTTLAACPVGYHWQTSTIAIYPQPQPECWKDEATPPSGSRAAEPKVLSNCAPEVPDKDGHCPSPPFLSIHSDQDYEQLNAALVRAVALWQDEKDRRIVAEKKLHELERKRAGSK